MKSHFDRFNRPIRRIRTVIL